MPEKPSPTSFVVPMPPSESVARPVGVTLLALLHFLWVLAFFLLAGTLWRNLDDLEIPLFAILSVIAIGVAIVGGIIALAIAVGLWLGRKWGWWLAGSLAALAIYSQLFSFAEYFLESKLSLQLGLLTLLWLALDALVIWYLMRPNVLNYFGLWDLSKGKALVILAGGGVVLALVYKAALWLASL